MRHFYLAIVSILLLKGCLSIARTSDFPTSSTVIDFDKFSKENSIMSQRGWIFDSCDEYYIETHKVINLDSMVNLISKALVMEGYKNFKVDTKAMYVIGK